MGIINMFRGDYAFLSNFYECKVTYEGMTFRSVEAAFQAAKCLDHEQRIPFTTVAANVAKRMGRKVILRDDWDMVKIDVMRDCLRSKFQNPDLVKKLLNTGNSILIEGNTWGDKFWGVDLRTNTGKNVLGNLLMELRKELQNVL